MASTTARGPRGAAKRAEAQWLADFGDASAMFAARATDLSSKDHATCLGSVRFPRFQTFIDNEAITLGNIEAGQARARDAHGAFRMRH